MRDGDAADAGDRLDAGRLPQVGQQFAVHIGGPGRLLEVAHRHRRGEDQQSPGVETHINARQRHQAADQDAGANHQHDGERDFGDDQHTACDAGACTRGGPLAALPQAVAEADLRHVKRRRQSEEKARHQRHREREDQHHAVDSNIADARERCGREGHEGQHPEPRQPDTQEARRQSEQRTFGEQLPDQSPARGADRGAHDHLARADAGARQEQVRHVGARDQEDHHDGAEQHVHSLANVADQQILQPDQRDGLALVARRIRLGQPRRNRHHLALRLLQADALA